MGVVGGYPRGMTTSPEPTHAQLPDEAPKREVPFDKEDLTFAPDDVVENSDADPDAEVGPDDDNGSSAD